jgi:hypothetical protein
MAAVYRAYQASIESDTPGSGHVSLHRILKNGIFHHSGQA